MATPVKELIEWNTKRDIAAMKRANNASTEECREANETAATAYRETIEALCRLAEMEK